MRVLHLATSRRGGAAIAAARIVEAQETVGLQAEIAYRGESRQTSDHVKDGTSLPPSSFRLTSGRAATLANRLITRGPSVLFTPLEVPSLSEKTFRDMSGPDIINTHNIYNFVSLDKLSQVIAHRPIVLTLHDERLLTAGCHYTLGCSGFEGNCHACPQSRLPSLVPLRSAQTAQRATRAKPNISWVAPSSWIRDQALRAGIDPQKVVHIPNPIDTCIFNAERRSRSRTDGVFTLAWLPGKEEGVVWQGVRLAQQELALRMQPTTLRIRTTRSAVCPPDVPTERVDNMQSDEARADFWAGADAAISITPADNFPNVALEAIATGTPLLVSDVGGAAEAVRETGGGIPLERSTPEALARACLDLVTVQVEWRQRSEEAIRRCHELYNYGRIGRMYEQHYQSVLGAAT